MKAVLNFVRNLFSGGRSATVTPDTKTTKEGNEIQSSARRTRTASRGSQHVSQLRRQASNSKASVRSSRLSSSTSVSNASFVYPTKATGDANAILSVTSAETNSSYGKIKQEDEKVQTIFSSKLLLYDILDPEKRQYSDSTINMRGRRLKDTYSSEIDVDVAISQLNNPTRKDGQTKIVKSIPEIVKALISPITYQSFRHKKFPKNLAFLYECSLYNSSISAFRLTSLVVGLFNLAYGFFNYFVHTATISFQYRAILLILCFASSFSLFGFAIIATRDHFKHIKTISFLSAALIGGFPVLFCVPFNDVFVNYSFKMILYLAVIFFWYPLKTSQRMLISLIYSAIRLILISVLFSSQEVVTDIILLLSMNVVGIYYSLCNSVIYRRSFMAARIFYQNQKTLLKARSQSERLLKNVLPISFIKEFTKDRRREFKNNVADKRKSFEIFNQDESDTEILKGSYMHFESLANRGPHSLSAIDRFKEKSGVTIMFADIVGFTELSSSVDAEYLVTILSVIFEKFDIFAESLGLEKIKTIGDCYQVCGFPDEPTTYGDVVKRAKKVCTMASCMLSVMEEISAQINRPLKLRIGIHTGNLLAGIVGVVKFKYDIWSQDVQIAALMEQTALHSSIHISESTAELLKGDSRFILAARDPVDIGNGYTINTFKLTQIWPHTLELVFPKEIISRLNQVEEVLFRSGNKDFSNCTSFNWNQEEGIMMIDKAPEPPSKEINQFFPLDVNQVVREIQAGEYKNADMMAEEFFSESVEQRWRKDLNNGVSIFRTKFTKEEEKEFNDKFSRNYGFLVSLSLWVVMALYAFCGVIYFCFYQGNQGFLIGMPIFLASWILCMVFLFVRELCLRKNWKAFQEIELENLKERQNKKLVDIESQLRSGSFRIVEQNFFCRMFVQPKIISMLIFTILYFGMLAAGVCTFYTSNSEVDFLFFGFYMFLFSSVAMMGAGSCGLNILLSIETIVYNALFLVSQHYANAKYDFYFRIFTFPFFSFLTLLLVLSSNHILDVANRKNYKVKKFLEEKILEINYIKNESENLLNNILPNVIADRLQKAPERRIAERYPEVCVLFISVCNFQKYEQNSQMFVLNRIFCSFDRYCKSFGVEKIKTSGNVYMAMAGGLPCKISKPSVIRIADYTLKLFELIKDLNKELNFEFELKAGFHIGSVVGGVIGRQKFCFDIWGDTVNTAARMEQTSEPGKIQITSEASSLLQSLFITNERGNIAIKGKGTVLTSYLSSRKPRALQKREKSSRTRCEASQTIEPTELSQGEIKER